jgi:cytochrome c-type biogenesis protein CcmE
MDLETGSTADAGLDLTPRTSGPSPARRTRRWLPMAIVAAVLIAGAFVLFQGLSNASVYFCNANEVGHRSQCEVSKRFRLQGTVDNGSVQATQGNGIHFTVTYAGTTIPVTYGGQPGGIFKEGIPVVIEGRMEPDGTFAGDRILVKHTEQYREKNPDRVTDYSE